MKICDKEGVGVCVNCDRTPPRINGYSCGDICRKKVQNIIDCLADGDFYRFDGRNLYRVDFHYVRYDQEKCEI